jgi:hypothetical protein
MDVHLLIVYRTPATFRACTTVALTRAPQDLEMLEQRGNKLREVIAGFASIRDYCRGLSAPQGSRPLDVRWWDATIGQLLEIKQDPWEYHTRRTRISSII